jgi:glycerol kinase
MKYLLGIDQGTTQANAVVVNELGQMVEKDSAQLPARFPQAGWVEQDPLDIVRTVKEACTPLVDKYDITAVGFDTACSALENAITMARTNYPGQISALCLGLAGGRTKRRY